MAHAVTTPQKKSHSTLIAMIALRSHIASNWPATLGRNFSTSLQYTVSLRSVAVYTENSLLSEKVKEIDIGVMELLNNKDEVNSLVKPKYAWSLQSHYCIYII